MKRRIIIVGSILVIFLTGWVIVPKIILKMVTDYPVFTLERVFNDEYWIESYGIGENKNPEDYGYDDVIELEFKSLNDDLKLSSWYVSTPNSDKCLVLVHGRTSNRLKPMKYLELFKKTGLDTVYDFFIPDLRNSGKSQSSNTLMGYKFAEDLLAGLLTVEHEKGHKQFVLYGFSMGAMAIFNLTGREDLMTQLDASGIVIDQMIFDSPLANVKEILIYQTKAKNIPDFLFKRSYSLFDEMVGGTANDMRMSTQMKKYKGPVLILHSKADRRTPYIIMKDEYNLMNENLVRLHTFEKVGHVKIYQSEKYKEIYTEIVSNFLRSDL